MSDAACDERSEGTDGPFATQEKRSNERRRLVTSEAKGPTAPQAHAVCNAREAKQCWLARLVDAGIGTADRG